MKDKLSGVILVPEEYEKLIVSAYRKMQALQAGDINSVPAEFETLIESFYEQVEMASNLLEDETREN